LHCRRSVRCFTHIEYILILLRAGRQFAGVQRLAAFRSLSTRASGIRTCMGLSLSTGVFRFIASSLFGTGSGRSSSRRLQSGSRSAGKWGQGTETLAKLGALPLAALVFGSALTPEHAEGRMRSEGSSRFQKERSTQIYRAPDVFLLRSSSREGCDRVDAGRIGLNCIAKPAFVPKMHSRLVFDIEP
jgi:hypothetical protein